MYNHTDGAGWCFTAYCDLLCNIIKRSEPCGSTTAPPSSSTLMPTPSTPSTPSTHSQTTPTTKYPPPPKNCTYLNPQRTVIWIHPNFSHKLPFPLKINETTACNNEQAPRLLHMAGQSFILYTLKVYSKYTD